MLLVEETPNYRKTFSRPDFPAPGEGDGFAIKLDIWRRATAASNPVFGRRFGSQIEIELDRASPLRRIWIVAVAVLVLDLPILAVDIELGALVLADLAPGINGILLLVEVAAATGRTVFLDVPAAIGVRDYMM